MTFHKFVVSLVIAAVGDPAARAGEDATTLMTRAREARATWDAFPGFSADVVVSENDSQAVGKLTVSARGEVSLALSESFAWAERELKSLVRHRIGSGNREYDVSFADKEKHNPFGRLIKVNDDASIGSLYRIRDDIIREVHSNMQNVRLAITVIDVAWNKEGKYLPSVYTVSYWDAKSGDLQSTSVVRDTWTRVGKWDLPAQQLRVDSTSDGKRQVKEIRFAKHRLLGADATSQ